MESPFPLYTEHWILYCRWSSMAKEAPTFFKVSRPLLPLFWQRQIESDIDILIPCCALYLLCSIAKIFYCQNSSLYSIFPYPLLRCNHIFKAVMKRHFFPFLLPLFAPFLAPFQLRSHSLYRSFVRPCLGERAPFHLIGAPFTVHVQHYDGSPLILLFKIQFCNGF